MARRAELGMKIDMLEIILREDQPTNIMYLMKTSWKTNMRILNDLVKRGLVIETTTKDNAKRYALTDAGYNNVKIAKLLVEKLMK